MTGSGQPRHPGQLPADTTTFVGRVAELARLAELLSRSRLVTVTGASGIGKTRLALRAAAQVATRFPDGVLLAELSALRDPGLLAHTVACSLGLPQQSPGSAQDAVLAHLGDRKLLLILDTCEHLIDACALFAEMVLEEAPGVTLLATSREPLDVGGENSYLVPPLPVPGPGAPASAGDAVELFAHRAAATVPGFTVTAANREDVTRVCRRLDGIPLAIELAAGRLGSLPLAKLADLLDDRLAVLTGGSAGDGRHRTLRDAIGWSYDLCTPDERTVWTRLSVFAGSFGIAPAEEVCSGVGLSRGQVFATIIRLVDKSVLLREAGAAQAPHGDDQQTRYRMLDAVREFGAWQLAASGTDAVIRDRHLAWYLAMAQYFAAHLLDDDQLERFRELHHEHANLRAALEFGLESQPGPFGNERRLRDGAALATALYGYWMTAGLFREGEYWLGKALDRFPGPGLERARALNPRSYLGAVLGEARRAEADAREAIRLAAHMGEPPTVARGYLCLNLALMFAGRLAAAARAGAEAERRMAALGDREGLITLDAHLGHMHLLNGDPASAIARYGHGLRLFGESRERWMHGYLHIMAAQAYFHVSGAEAECAQALQRSLECKREIGDTAGIAYALETFGWLAARAARHERAAWLLGAADPLWKLAGSRLSNVAALESLHALAAARASAALGGKRFGALFARGSRRPLDQVVALALDDADELPAEQSARTASGDLTSREQQVAGLISAGLSNREIADRMAISKRTVDAHLEHIYGKLRLSSRVELALWLQEHPTGSRGAPVPAR